MVLIKKIQVKEDYTLLVEFSDGVNKIVDLRPYIKKGVFTQLKDKTYFGLVKNYHYYISWPNEQELSADTLYYG